jgi:hypothetical protein
MIGDELVEHPSEVRGEFVRYFYKHFSEVNWTRRKLDELDFTTCSMEKYEKLISHFSE